MAFAKCNEYFEILKQMRAKYPSLRDDQLLMAMFMLEDEHEDDIRHIAKAGNLFQYSVQEIALFCSEV